MESLEHYIEKYGSDKKLSGYTPLYEDIFDNIRENVERVLEVGIGTLDPQHPSTFCGNPAHYPHYKPGGSLRAWRDYFPQAKIIGVDIGADCKFTEDRIQTFIFSSLEQDKCDRYLSEYTFDIIIDDGLHTVAGQIQTLNNLFSKVKFNGYYIIEDCGGGGDDKNVFVEGQEDVLKVIGQHEYFFRSNILIVRKTYSKKGLLSTPPVGDLIPRTDLTVVTGLWNIGRPGRPFETYLELFEKTLEIENNMFVFIPKEYEHIVWKKRSKKNTSVKIFELEDIKKIFDPFWDQVQKIRTDPEWYGQADWLQKSPQAALEYYNPIVMSKMFLLHEVTLWNPFNNSKFIWLDAGITNTVHDKFLTEQKALDKLDQFLDPFLFLCYPYETNTEIHGFKKDAIDRFARKNVSLVCRGGLFGGTKEAIHEANGTYYALLHQSLNAGYMGTEESIFSVMTHLEPDKYRRYMLDSNGLIVKFIQDILLDKAVLEPVPEKRLFTNKPTVFNLEKYKTYLYILTFNFPDQLRTLLNNFKEHPEWLSKTQKVLIDNSTNPEAKIENEKIASEYGFVHYQAFDNIGINGGRQYAAEHFDKTDGDYYFFFEDDMCLHNKNESSYCRNGFRQYIPDLYNTVHKIMIREKFDFLKLSFTEVYMDNNVQCSWYNIPQEVRTVNWPDYDKLPVSGLDPNTPRTTFKNIESYEGLSFITGDVYYCNWPMIVSKKGNRKMFLDTKWARPYEQTWMSHIFQETRKDNIYPAVLLASPINHNRILHYKPDERREN